MFDVSLLHTIKSATNKGHRHPWFDWKTVYNAYNIDMCVNVPSHSLRITAKNNLSIKHVKWMPRVDEGHNLGTSLTHCTLRL